ncbi:hypothetical protein J6590_025223 [Homalodisca vitripennis]|nr:hypothetical protein J6590_025223 [Homalodisca vitripennis]
MDRRSQFVISYVTCYRHTTSVKATLLDIGTETWIAAQNHTTHNHTQHKTTTQNHTTHNTHKHKTNHTKPHNTQPHQHKTTTQNHTTHNHTQHKTESQVTVCDKLRHVLQTHNFFIVDLNLRHHHLSNLPHSLLAFRRMERNLPPETGVTEVPKTGQLSGVVSSVDGIGIGRQITLGTAS